QPAQPTLTCYQSASFNTTSCQWDVTGTQPAQPTIACYETATFNNTTCSWDVTGSQPAQPTGLLCYQTSNFNTTSCSWVVTGTQPAQPTLACYETATFNNTTCSWDVTGTQPAQPTITASGATTFCAGGSVTLTSSYASGNVWSNGATTESITVSASGSYTVTTAVSGCNLTSSATVVTANALPNVSISGSSSYCIGGSTTLTANGASSYVWSDNSTGTSLVASAAGTYSVIGTDANGCSNTASLSVTENALPTAAISGASAICAGSSATLTASGGVSYLWSDASTSATLSVNAAGTYTVTVTDANGCSASASHTVSVNALPTAPTVSASGATTFCAGGSVTLTSDYVGGNTWSNAATTDAITVSTSGSYTVTYTDANGCTATSAATVVVVNTASVAITGNATYCAGGSQTLTATATPAAVSYAWSLNGSPLASTTNTVSANAAGTYTVVTTDANGCTATANKVVNQAAVFTVGVTSSCSTWFVGNSTTLTATPSISGSFTYSWNGGLGTAATATTSTAGNYTATVTDAYGCTATGSFAVAGAPLSGTYTTGSNACGSFGTLKNAIDHLNAYGVSGPVTINVGGNETAPAGGYAITATGTSTNTITINGNSKTITASNALTVGSINDAIFKIIGGDYITIQNFTMLENAANTISATAATNNMTEFGVALFYADTTNGAQYNTIKNNTITLNRAYLNTIGVYSNTRTSSTAMTSAADATTANGSNSYNKVYSNTINNVNYGIVFIGSKNIVAMDYGNELGGAAAGQGNTITNWGGGSSLSSYSSLTANNYCIFSNHQLNNTISRNTITSAALAQGPVAGGILVNYSTTVPSAVTTTTDINYNSVTVTNAATTAATGGVIGINTQGISTLLPTATINITNNTVSGCTLGGTVATSIGLTGITNLSLVGTVNINNNTLTNNQINSTAGVLTGSLALIQNSGASTTMNINDNIITGNAITTPTATSALITGIYNSGAVGTLNILRNTLNTFATKSTTGQFQGISNNAGAVVTALNISDNKLGNSTSALFTANGTAANTGAFYGIYATTGSATCAVTFNGNRIGGNITYNVASTATQYYFYNSIGATSSTETITNDSLTIPSGVNTSGTVYMFYIYNSTPNATVSGNYVNGFTRSHATAGASMYVMYNSTGTTTPVAGTVHNVFNNQFLNINNGVSTSSYIYGLYYSGYGQTCNMYNNTINGWSETLLAAGYGSIYALYPYYYPTTFNIYNNTINGLTINSTANATTSTTASNIYGMYHYLYYSSTANVYGNTFSNFNTNLTTMGSTTTYHGVAAMMLYYTGSVSTAITNVYKNRIFNLNTKESNAYAFATGIRTNYNYYGGDVRIHNNMIGGLSAVSATGVSPVNGMELNVWGTNYAVNLDIAYNTILLDTIAGGTGAGFSGIYANPTYAKMILRNNIIVTKGIANATGKNVALRFNSTTYTNYSTLSNNNIFYAGTASGTNYIFSDGTNNAQTLSAFQALANISPRETNSYTEDVPFVSTARYSSYNANNWLHINPSVATFVEGGAKAGLPYTEDIDGTTRSLLGPDIGADEGNFTGLLPSVSSITASPATGQCTAVNHTVTVVASASVTSATLNYSYNGVAQTGIAMTSSGSNTWTAVIPAATSPLDANVTWSATVTTGTYSTTVSGTGYQDAYLLSNTLTATVSPNAVCLGGSVNLNAYIGSSAAAPTTYASCTATSTSDEEILGVTLGTMSNSSICGTVAPGAGSTAYMYSNYTTSVQAPLLIAGSTVTGSVTAGYCGTSSYSNIIVVYIDWNRDGDFADAGENAWTSAYGTKTFPSQVIPFSITVPTTGISYGRTRMRVVINESSSAPATGTFTYGEVEDYIVSIAGGNGFTYTWSDGTSNVFTGTGSYTPPAAANMSLSVTGVDPNGCILYSTPVALNVSAVPSAPTATASSQCGTGTPKIKVSGAAAGTGYNWYLAASGGLPIQSGATDSLSNYSISTTTTFYVSTQMTTSPYCESPRTAVVATVVIPDAVSITSSGNNICPNTSVTLTANQTGTTNTYVYTWNGVGVSPTTGSSVTATPTSAGATVYNVTAVDTALGCVTTASISVTSITPPSISGYSATPSTVCAGEPLTLLGTTTVITSGPQTAPDYTAQGNPSFSSTSDEEIWNVTLGTINNTSNCATVAPGPGSVNSSYSNYTTSVAAATITAGQTYSASVTVGYCGTSSYSNIACMFIDYNRDGDFLDAGETVWTKAYGTSLFTGTAYPFNVTVPMTATPGVTRMRVVLTESSTAPTPAQSGSWGEGEDYLVNILAPGQAAGSYTWSWSDGSSVISTSNTVSVSPTVPTTYTVSATDPATGCISTATVTPTVNPLPAAPTATGSVQCGAGIPTASVASNSGLSTPQFNWYNASLNGTLLQGPPANSGPLATVYTNNFSSASALGGATVSGNGSVTGGYMQLTPNVTSNLGGLTIPASGSNAAAYQVDFKIYTSAAAGSGADGMSYSFGDDASATTTVINAEYGSGSKLAIGFDTYDAASTANGQGIRLMYGNTVNNPGITVGTNGVLAYSTNVAWTGGTWVPVQISISNIGKLTMTVNGVTVFNNVALPAAYLSANKANWKHVFKGRTGGVSQIHGVDDVTIQQSGPTAGYTSYNSSITSTTTFYVSEQNGTTGCNSVRTPVVATVNQPDSVAVSATVASTNNCLGTTVTLTAANTGTTNTYNYTWNGGTSSGISTPQTGSTITVTPTAAGTYTYTVTANDATAGCNYTNSVSVTINANPSIDSISATPSTICAGDLVTLRGYTMSAGPQTQPNYTAQGNPSFSSTLDEEIFNVTLGTLNNTSTCSSVASGPGSVLSSYNNYTTSVAAPTLVAGQTVNASVTVGYCATSTYSNIARMFIDYNRDGDFLDADEIVWTKAYGTSLLSGTAYPFTVTIPATATPGLTRMRVVLIESSTAPTPAQTGSWGEGEDYLVNIIGLGNGGASTTWAWSPNGATTNITTVNPTTTTTYTALATNAAGCTTSNNVTVNVNPLPAAPTAVDNTVCGFNMANVAVTSNTGFTTPVMNWYLDSIGNTSQLTGQSGLSLNAYYLSLTDTFYVSESNATTGCKSPRTAVIQNVTQPDAVTASSSSNSICLPGASINLSATQTGSTNNYTYSWTAVPPVGSGLSGVVMGPVTTLFSNDFSNSTLPSNVTVTGNASITGGVLQVTPNLLSQTGGVKIVAGGNAADTIAVDFDLIVPQNGADGVSYSYSNDGVATVDANMNAENGTGSKLKLGFVSYTNGTSTNGIYLMYNCTTNEQTPTTSGVLAYSSNVSWRGSASPVHVAYTVGSTGLFNLSLNGTPIFTNVQLPASYVSSNKSSWYHIFKGRTGGVSEEHSIDNMVVKVAQIQSSPTPGQNLTITPTVAGTYTYQVTATDGGCNAISTVTVVANPPAAPISAGADVSVCEGGNVNLNAASAGLIPTLRFTEISIQAMLTSGGYNGVLPSWFPAAGNSSGNDLIEITNLGLSNTYPEGVTFEQWTSSTATAPAQSFVVPAGASMMNPGSTLFIQWGSPLTNDLTHNYYSFGQSSYDQYSSGVAYGYILKKNGVIIDAVATNGFTFPAVAGVTSADWSGTIPSNSGLTGVQLYADDNNTASSWRVTNSSTAPTSYGTMNAGVSANLPSTGNVTWTSIPSGFTGTSASGTFGPINATTSFVVLFDNGTCQSTDTVVVTPVSTPPTPVIVSNKDSICITGSAVYTNTTAATVQGVALQWQSYDVATSTWVDIAGANAATYTTPTFAPVLGDTVVYYRLKAGCTNIEYSNVDTLQISLPYITSTTGATLCGAQNATVSAVGNGTMNWYTGSTGGSPVVTGNPATYYANGTQILWLQANVGTCANAGGRQPVTVIVNPSTPVTITSTAAAICQNQSATLTASSTDTAYAYTWNGGLGTGATVTVSPMSTTTYNVYAYNATTGCGSTQSYTVTVNILPTAPVITASTAVLCPGNATTLTATSIVNGPQTDPGSSAGNPAFSSTADE
ncbi:MAG: GEVED domain-containing protein, partial [Bacteroidota bacterium]